MRSTPAPSCGWRDSSGGAGARLASLPRARTALRSATAAPVLTFIVRRTAWTLLIMFVITLLVFVIFFKTPGVDPARQIAGRNPSPAILHEIRHQFGLDRPFPVQYGLMMKK